MSSHPGASQAASAAQREWQKSREKFSTSPGPPKCAVPGIRERFVCCHSCDSRPFEKKKQNPLRRVRPCVVRARAHVCVCLCVSMPFLLYLPRVTIHPNSRFVHSSLFSFFLVQGRRAEHYLCTRPFALTTTSSPHRYHHHHHHYYYQHRATVPPQAAHTNADISSLSLDRHLTYPDRVGCGPSRNVIDDVLERGFTGVQLGSVSMHCGRCAK